MEKLRKTALEAIHFDADDPVPEWLLSQTPLTPEFIPAIVVFLKPCLVIEVGDFFVFIEREKFSPGPFIGAKYGNQTKLNAGSKSLALPLDFQFIFGPDDLQNWGKGKTTDQSGREVPDPTDD